MPEIKMIEQPEISDDMIQKCPLCFEKVLFLYLDDEKDEKNIYPCEKYRVSLIDNNGKIHIGYRSHFDVCEGYRNLNKTV